MIRLIYVCILVIPLFIFSCKSGNSSETDNVTLDEDQVVSDTAADNDFDLDENEKTDTADTPETDNIVIDIDQENDETVDPDTDPDTDIETPDENGDDEPADDDVIPCSPQGTLLCPYPVNTFPFYHENTTVGALSDEFDSYPPNTVDESGPEYIYSIHVSKEQYYYFSILRPEPDGVDVDLQLLKSESPYELIQRNDKSFFIKLSPGDYLFTIDTYNGDDNAGEYVLSINHEQPVFNDYILAAVEYLYDEYKLLGYDSAVLTHDITYGEYGIIPMTGGGKTMCVAAVMEVILTAMNIYSDETGDDTVFDTLPIGSWKYLHSYDLKAHIWVNSDLNAGGTADALRNFNMGGNIPFEELEPGSFININRTTGTGHAVIFLSFIDINGDEYTEYNEDIIGFRYFSSQGGYDVGAGGLDYRYAIFDEFGTPTMPYKRDTQIIYSEDQQLLNTGVMFMPEYWNPATDYTTLKPVMNDYLPASRFDPLYFNGITIDDNK